MDDTPDNSQPAAEADVHHKIGLLTRQLHDSLNELGYADKLRGSMGELPDAQSRLSYIARLTGEAAEKVLNRVEQAKAQHDYIAAETRRVVNSLVADPVAAVATALALGATLVWARPWRWTFRYPVLSALGPSLLTRGLASELVQTWLATALSKMTHAPAPPQASHTDAPPVRSD